MKKYLSLFVFSALLFVSFTSIVSAATAYSVSNTSQIGKTVILSWEGNYAATAKATIVLSGPSRCNTDAAGNITICTRDITRTVLGTVPASDKRFAWTVLDGSLGKTIIVEIGGVKVDFVATLLGSSSANTPPSPVFYPVEQFSASVFPSTINAGEPVTIVWTGTYTEGSKATIVFERPSSCSVSQGGSVFCTNDLREIPVATLEASKKLYRWVGISSSETLVGNIKVMIGAKTASASLRVNASGSASLPNATSGENTAATSSTAFPFSAVCKKTLLASGQTEFSVTYKGGTAPFSHVWLDNGTGVESLSKVTAPGLHKISILATDSREVTAYAECGEITLKGAEAPKITVGITEESSSLSCTNIGANLARGSRNSGVVSLQQFLKYKNLFSGEATGYFGAVTELSVKSFQAANGIEASGFVGPLTRAKIKSLSCAL